MAERFRLPRVITGSSWSNVWGSLWAKPARGTVTGSDGTLAPKYTNREASAIISGLRALAPMTAAGFSLWYQYAAAAYGWTPDNDRLDTTQRQGDSIYDPDAAVLLQLEMQRITGDLDEQRTGQVDPRLDLDSSVFDDLTFQGEVVRALKDDGANAFAIPSCKDPKTGKPGKFPRRNPKTGKWECDLETTDPLKGAKKLHNTALAIIVIGGLILWLGPAILAGSLAQPRRGRRTRRRY